MNSIAFVYNKFIYISVNVKILIQFSLNERNEKN